MRKEETHLVPDTQADLGAVIQLRRRGCLWWRQLLHLHRWRAAAAFQAPSFVIPGTSARAVCCTSIPVHRHWVRLLEHLLELRDAHAREERIRRPAQAHHDRAPWELLRPHTVHCRL